MKQIILLSFIFILVTVTPIFAAGDTVSVSINGEISDKIVYIDDKDYSLLPVRWVAEQFQCSLIWDSNRKAAVLSRDNKEYRLESGKNFILTENGEIKIDTEIKIIEERLFVPIRGFAQCFNLEVKWNQDTKTIYIMEPSKILYQDEELGVIILTPNHYSKRDYDIVKSKKNNEIVLSFFVHEKNQFLFSLNFFDIRYWNKEVKDNFPLMYSEIYKNDSMIVLCVNATDVQYPPDDIEQKEIYEQLLNTKEEICNTLCFFTS